MKGFPIRPRRTCGFAAGHRARFGDLDLFPTLAVPPACCQGRSRVAREPQSSCGSLNEADPPREAFRPRPPQLSGDRGFDAPWGSRWGQSGERDRILNTGIRLRKLRPISVRYGDSLRACGLTPELAFGDRALPG